MADHFNQKELERYSRHLVIPEVGLEGQAKLRSAKVLIAGAGGLGSPIAMYLAAAGVGNIGIIDFDTVSFSNLQRQVLFSEADLGKPKVEIAKQRLNGINKEINVKTYNFKLTAQNALEIISGYDIVADGSDNFSTRYLINDACVFLGKPLVSGSVLRFEGQVSFFDPKEGPCYRCLYPESPEPGSMPSCEEAGVLGVLPGIIGTIQADEVIKYIIGKGKTLTGRLLTLDALQMKFKEFKFGKNPNCPVCGENPVIRELMNYDENCNDAEARLDGISASGNSVINNGWEISVEDLKRKMETEDRFYLLDVREPFESRISTIGGHIIPINDLPKRIDELNKDDNIIVYCRTGYRSEYAVKYLRDIAGFPNVKNLKGGINEWADKIDKSIIKY
jgi:molybdopterin/thiamine biosynthesis adenylyltransferase/rhodanese-related sulfurtransferase